MNKKKIEYVLITPAHNEEDYIEETIKSVISQTHLPEKWVIVSDGSTDRTDEIVSSYLNKYKWIEFVRLPEHRDRQFAAKVLAFNAGYEKVKDMEYQVIGNLDADISFENDFFSFLMEKFQTDEQLGVAGTPFVEDKSVVYNYKFTNIDHVSGQCQLFKRECFEDIGGYDPIKEGGIDWVAVTKARMKGWKTRTFPEKHFFHHRKMGTGRKNNFLVARFNYGQKDYFLGGHPLWEVFRVLYQISKKPYIFGGMALGFGYVHQSIFHRKRPISKELVAFNQKEQLTRLKKIFKRK